MTTVPDGSVSLVVTSPPYPMIELWDAQFAAADPETAAALSDEDGARAFDLMHARLDPVWRECHRVLQPGGLACINVGDATRKIGGEFRLFSNHSRILQALTELGFSVLPDILWRKPTNAPNKFLGSGMLPAGAYVTYEHEYILIARKGGLRRFSPADKARRRRSAFFWEERNVWFSDVWLDLVGTRQRLGNSGLDDPEARVRSAAYPFELAYRLVQMHSLIGDTVLDPFLGTGTTTAAAIAGGRSSIGFELEHSLERPIRNAIETAVPLGREYAQRRLDARLCALDLQARQPPIRLPGGEARQAAPPLISPPQPPLRLPGGDRPGNRPRTAGAPCAWLSKPSRYTISAQRSTELMFEKTYVGLRLERAVLASSGRKTRQRV